MYYQYEVTFGLYCMNSTEKFILNTVVLGLLCLFAIPIYFLAAFMLREVGVENLYWLYASRSGVRHGVQQILMLNDTGMDGGVWLSRAGFEG